EFDWRKPMQTRRVINKTKWLASALAAPILFASSASAQSDAQAAQAPSAEQAWPDEENRNFVQDRLKTFPRKLLVKQVEWYQPQEPVAGGNAKPIEPIAEPTIPAATLDAAQKLVEDKDSYAFLIWRRGNLEHEYYAPGSQRSSRFATASMAKTVVALSLGVAIDQGKIGSAQDRVDKYISTTANTKRGAVPLRNYLEMASLFETPSAGGPDADIYWQYALGRNIGEAVARWPETCDLSNEFCYANSNTAMLGWALEGATGMRYSQWLSQSIWQPIGAGDGRLWIDREGGWPRYSCCLHASGQDWLRIGMLIANKGKFEGRQIVSEQWIEQMLAPSSANPNYGFQIWRGSPHNPSRKYGKSVNAVVPAAEPFARDDVYYLDGSAGQRVYIIPSEEMVIVRIGAPRFDWDDAELPNIILRGL
ncbi:MAG: serine hydrolase, partial [Marinomonas sp.]